MKPLRILGAKRISLTRLDPEGNIVKQGSSCSLDPMQVYTMDFTMTAVDPDLMALLTGVSADEVPPPPTVSVEVRTPIPWRWWQWQWWLRRPKRQHHLLLPHATVIDIIDTDEQDN